MDAHLLTPDEEIALLNLLVNYLDQKSLTKRIPSTWNHKALYAQELILDRDIDKYYARMKRIEANNIKKAS